MPHDIAYTFTREELTTLLEDLTEETHIRYCEIRAQTSFRKATDAWPTIVHQEIVAVLQRLDFDATRPAEPSPVIAPVCPQCHGPLLALVWSSQSLLNRDQWASQRAGDFLCRTCPDNGRGEQPFAFFWKAEVEAIHG